MRGRFSLLFFFLIYHPVFSTTYYSRQNGNWNASTTWSTVTYGNATNAGTYPQAGDIVFIGDGHLIDLTHTPNTVQDLTIGQGVSGILNYQSGTNTSLSVTGNLTVNVGAIFGIENGGPNTSTLNITGNLTNNGAITFRNANGGNKQTDIYFVGASNTVVSGTGTWDFFKATLNKTNKTNYVDNQSATFTNTFLSGFNAYKGWLFSKGTYIHDNTITLDYLDNTRYQAEVNAGATIANLDILEGVVIQATQGTLNLATSADNVVALYGGMTLSGGTIAVGGGTGASGGIRYATPTSGTATLTVNSGTLNVVGTITFTVSSPLTFSMTGGTINVSTGTNQPASINFQVNDVATSSSTISGGTINIKRNTSATSSFKLNGSTPANVTVTGGTVVFGNATTSMQFKYSPFASAQYPNMRVSGASGTSLVANAAADSKFLSLYIAANNTFDFVNNPSNNVTLTSTYDGTNAFYNDGTLTVQTGKVTFTGTSNQGFAGSVITSFYNFEFNGSGGATLYLNENVTNTLTMTQGKTNLNSKIFTLGTAATAANAGTLTYVGGWLYGGTFTRWQYTTSYTIGNARGLMPMGTSTVDYRPIWIAYAGNLSAGGTVSAVHSPTYPSWYNLSSYFDASWGFSVQGISNSSWTLSTANGFTPGASDLQVRFGGTGFGVFTLTDLNASLAASAVGTFGAATSTSVPLEVNRTALTNAQLNNTWYIGTKNISQSPLPITLVTFTAVPSGNYVSLDWVTATETNNDHFTIERSADGISFSPLLTVAGAGNSSSTLYYHALDESPLSGISYYRLQQTDFNGSSTWSNIVAVEMATELSVNIFPNPSSSGQEVQVNISGSGDGSVLVVVNDMLGREYYSKVFIFENGPCAFAIDKEHNLAAGVYLVTASSNDKLVSKKIIIR